MISKEQVFRTLEKEEKIRNEYYDSLPSDMKDVLYNEYIESLYRCNDLLIDALFDEHADSVNWFLHEGWEPGDEVGVVGENLTPIHNIDEYIEWMKTHEGFEG